MSNLTINITEAGMHIINYTCEKCFNITKCPMPIDMYYSNYQVNWVFLGIVFFSLYLIHMKFMEIPLKSFLFSMLALVVLSIIGGLLHMMSGLLMVIIGIILSIYYIIQYKEELGI